MLTRVGPSTQQRPLSPVALCAVTSPSVVGWASSLRSLYSVRVRAVQFACVSRVLYPLLYPDSLASQCCVSPLLILAPVGARIRRVMLIGCVLSLVCASLRSVCVRWCLLSSRGFLRLLGSLSLSHRSLLSPPVGSSSGVLHRSSFVALSVALRSSRSLALSSLALTLILLAFVRSSLST